MKCYLAVLGVMLVAIAIIVSFSLASATSSAQNINLAGPETQFRLNVAYAYMGEGPSNASYTAANRTLMSPISQYPSAVVLNSILLPDTQIRSCDALIEFYNIKIATNTGLVENHCYFIGTNYNPSFSSSELSSLFAHVKDLTASKDFITVRGNFEFNMTANTSFLSNPVGSVSCYSNCNSSAGLWSAGKPDAISVTVHRIGYLTASHGSVSLFEDTSISSATAVKQLSNYGDGFLYNSLVPATKLPKTDLFHPDS